MRARGSPFPGIGAGRRPKQALAAIVAAVDLDGLIQAQVGEQGIRIARVENSVDSQGREVRIIEHQRMRAVPVELTDHLTKGLIPEYETPLRPGSDRLDGWAFVGLDATLSHRGTLSCRKAHALDSR